MNINVGSLTFRGSDPNQAKQIYALEFRNSRSS